MKPAAWLVGSLLALALSACGGGDEAPAPRVSRQSIDIGGLTIPPDAATKGMWGPVQAWPMIPVHAVMLADGRVLTYGTTSTGQQSAYFNYDLWDPALGTGSASHLTLPNTTATDIFCGSQAQLASGLGVVLSGGDNWTGSAVTNKGNRNSAVFTTGDNSLVRGQDMTWARWYATSTVLSNGEVMIQGGIDELGVAAPYSEIRGLDGTYRSLPGISSSGIGWTYPRNFVVSGGRVFGFDTFGNTYELLAEGQGSISRYSPLSGPTGIGSSAAMFRPGKILQFGGSSNKAVVIDVTAGGAPVYIPTQPLASQRIWVNSTILPDGKVLATGGSRVDNQMTDVAYSADIWDPMSGSWTVGNSATKARLYHSVAILLADGSVMVGGGGAPGPQTNTNVEIYYPPYLFTAAGELASRPAWTAGPAVAEVGSTVRLEVNSARPISRVTLVRTGAVTHSFNSEQRFSELVFARDGDRVVAQLPSKAGEVPPGNYMIFAIDDAGVPSEARILRINIAADPNPSTVPVVQPLTSQSILAGATVSLQVQASDPNGDKLGYAAAGLPAGLAINEATGLISGSPVVEGSYDVVVSASDGLNSASQAFTLTVIGNVPIAVEPAVGSPPATSQAGLAAGFAAAASGLNPRYSWRFGDGSPDTDWSTLGSASHVYAQPGTFVVTVTARDELGRQATYSFMQSVYLPAVASRPTASSSIVVESRPGGGRRVWVVNQDNNSVSVFDEGTQQRIAEIPTGTQSRQLAIAADGRVWVTNKQSGGISVIDPRTLQVVAGIGLPRAAQPHGLVMSPDGRYAFVSLEAIGKVMKYDTATLVRLATAAVGANPRHLAVTADGTEVWVSRFITGMQPGESTASVGSTIDGAKTGGEVVVLNAGSLATKRVMVLEHSTREDSERSGRGVPNYLGAAAISPDGSQAWIPSKQDNILRGMLRDGRDLDFQNTVRAVASRIDTAIGREDHASRIDLDNAGVASAALFDRRGVYLFVALETSREVAVVDAHRRAELFRFAVGRAPQGLALSPDGLTLYVENFMDRSLGSYDLRPLVERGQALVPLASSRNTVAKDKLAAQVLLGKQHFYDARDTRLARDGYLSCATCHNDAGHDGRVWDLTGSGEGLRRTIALRGKARQGGHGFLHWSGNFDEVQDFEGQIRRLASGSGLMSDAQFGEGTTSQPLGTPKAGKSADLDALAAYVSSLTNYDNSPYYPAGEPTTAFLQGQALFKASNCAACHGGEAFSSSGQATLHDIGTLKPSSGKRLGGTLAGIDPPTLRGAWAFTAYLHDGSAPNLQSAIRAHRGVTISDSDLELLAGYVKAIGKEEVAAPVNPGTGSGLGAEYFANASFKGTPAYTRTEPIDFNWGAASPGSPLGADGWSGRWRGWIEAPFSGTYWLQVVADDGAKVQLDGAVLLDRMGARGAATNTTLGPVYLVSGQRYQLAIWHQDFRGDSTLRLLWRPPGSPEAFTVVPAERLIADAP